MVTQLLNNRPQAPPSSPKKLICHRASASNPSTRSWWFAASSRRPPPPFFLCASIDLKGVQAKNSRYYIPPNSRSSNSIALRFYDSIEKNIRKFHLAREMLIIFYFDNILPHVFLNFYFIWHVLTPFIYSVNIVDYFDGIICYA